MKRPFRLSGRWVLLFLLFGSLLPSAAAEETRLEIFEVERTKSLFIPTQGPARVLILNPSAIELFNASETGFILVGRQIDSSVVHVWDRSGRRTLRVIVTELRSIVLESKEQEREALQRKLGLPNRSLKLNYRGNQRHLERGEKVSLRTNEEYRVRTHEWKATMGIPAGRLAANAYLEQRRERVLDKEVTQPRHLSLALQEFSAGPLGKADLILGDKDLSWSDFTLPGTRYRGAGFFPSADPSGKNQPLTGPQVSLFGGEEREGYGLDLQAGLQTRKARSHLGGLLVEVPVLEGWKAHATGLHREGKAGEFKSNHVFEVGLDGAWNDRFKLDIDAARNGPEGAYQTDFTFVPFEKLSVRNRLWRVGKEYRTVTGTISHDGESGWSNSVSWTPPVAEDRLTLSSLVTLYRDRNAPNPANPRELNSLYSAGLEARLPWQFKFQSSGSYEDLSGTSFPLLTQRFDANLTKDLTLPWPWFSSLSPYVGYRYHDFDKSNGILGQNAVVEVLRAGARANLLRGFWVAGSFSQGFLHEQEPETGAADTEPREWILEAGSSHSFQKIPLALNTTVRYVDVQETFAKTHQPFSDRNQISGNLQADWKWGPDRSVFGSFSASRQEPETGGGNPLVELFAEFGVRLGWDTKWAPLQTGSVSGFVFQDLNVNTRRDPKEPGLPGVQVYVPGGPSAQTNAQGAYLLRGIREGPASIRVDWNQIPAGYFFTSANAVEHLILPGKKSTADFGISTEVEFRGQVYNDMDGDRRYTEEIDLPLQGVRLRLETGSSAISGPTGYYSIRRTPPGLHTLTVEIASIPNGYRSAAPLRQTTESQAGEVVSYDLPFLAQRVISGSVFVDFNGNQVRNPDEPGVPGVLLEFGNQGAWTDAEGRYRFSALPPGEGQVRILMETIPSELRLASPEMLPLTVPSEPFSRESLNFILLPDSPENRSALRQRTVAEGAIK